MIKYAVHMLIGLGVCASCSSHQICHEGPAVSKNGLQTVFNNLLTKCPARLGVEGGHFHQLRIIYYISEYVRPLSLPCV
jgi:hypothetical protein